MACRFARRHGQPVVCWQLPLMEKYDGKLSASKLSLLYDRVQDLTAFFVVGAPATLTANIRPEKLLSNGARCLLDKAFYIKNVL
jgi:hypothetical protein